jgi:hypothetical protein
MDDQAHSPQKSGGSLVDPEKGIQDFQEVEPEKQQRKLTGFKWFLFVVSDLTAIFLYALDNTIVANIAPVRILLLFSTPCELMKHP